MPRIIKKYANRRLYDTESSAYITLEALKDLILNHVDLQVIDAKTSQDLTLDCFFNILLEQENKSKIKLFSKPMLEHLIRSYDNHLKLLEIFNSYSDFSGFFGLRQK